jgi:ankyrin repeat protein
MSEAEALPASPNLDWYKKSAKKRLAELRARDPETKLADAQLAVAREHGFSTWRKLKDRVDQLVELPRLFEAIQKDDRAAIRTQLKAKPGLSRLADSEGRTAIHVAAECNNPDAIEILLLNRADPEAYFGRSAHNALSWSLTVNANESAGALVRGGIEPDFFCAAGMGDVHRVRAFFDSRGNLARNSSRTGSSRWVGGKKLPAPPPTARERISDALYFASRNGHPAVVEELLAHDPDLSFRAFLSATSLHWAYFSGRREVVELLLRAGADPTLRDGEYNCTPRAFGICVASSWGFPGIFARVLRMDPAAVNILEGRGTPLHEAARAGNAPIVQALLAAGADPSIRDAEGQTALDLARAGGSDGIVEILQSISRGN